MKSVLSWRGALYGGQRCRCSRNKLHSASQWLRSDPLGAQAAPPARYWHHFGINRNISSSNTRMSSEILNVTERRGSTAGLTRLSRARQLWHCPGSAMLGQRWASSAGGRATNVDAPPVMTFAPGARLTGFITDVEGNARYLKSYCAPRGPSRVLTYSGTPAAGAAGDDEALVWNRHGLRLELRDGAHLVVGGDCFDKGAGDLRIAKAVVDLKRRHPERVFLLVGNRDNNKMRFSSELDPADVARAPTSIPRPYWLPPQALSFSSFLEEEWGDSRRFDEATPEQRAATKLRWMHRHTMGCPHTFEMRRAELWLLNSGRAGAPDAVADVPDDAVARSFRYSVMPREEVAEAGLEAAEAGPHALAAHRIASVAASVAADYLAHAQLAVVIGDTVAVHGAITAANAGFLPHDDSGDGPGAWKGDMLPASVGLVEWLSQLNAWYHRGLDDWRSRPRWNEQRTERGGAGINGYGHALCMEGRSIMVSSYMDADHHPTASELSSLSSTGLPESSWLGCTPPADSSRPDQPAVSPIRRILSGHQPFGASPTVLKVRDADRSTVVEAINGDTSFSSFGWGESQNGRDAVGQEIADAVASQRPHDATAAAIDTHHSDNRGLAVAEVAIRADPDAGTSSARVIGRLPSNEDFDVVLPAVGQGTHERAEEIAATLWGLDEAGEGVDAFVGLQLRDVEVETQVSEQLDEALDWGKAVLKVAVERPGVAGRAHKAELGHGYNVADRWVKVKGPATSDA